MTTPTKTPPTWLSIDEFCRRHSWARPGTLRHAILHSASNGFAKCVVRAGRRVLLIEAEVFAWYERRRALPIAAAEPTRTGRAA
ncbi:MAG: hypothetical protein U1F43_37835 [Myxococcota bacterium]